MEESIKTVTNVNEKANAITYISGSAILVRKKRDSITNAYGSCMGLLRIGQSHFSIILALHQRRKGTTLLAAKRLSHKCARSIQ